MHAYKLIDRSLRAYGNFRYTLGNWTPTLTGWGPLCTGSWYHVYDHPSLAVLFNILHANVVVPKLFECTYDGRSRTKDDSGLKRGVVSLRLDKEVPLPVFSPDQCVRFAIYCARNVYHGSEWISWTKHWCGGLDRSEKSAMLARRSVKESNGCGRENTIQCLAENAAKAAANAAEYAVGTDLGEHYGVCGASWQENGVGAVARAAKHAGGARGWQKGEQPRTSSYWVGLIEKAIADEEKVVVAKP